MKAFTCISCREQSLTDRVVEPNLWGKACVSCGGVWIPAAAYWQWLEREQDAAPRSLAAPGPVETPTDTGPAKRCPECGTFLTHARVGHGLNFHLDRCSHCGGFWLNPGEWEALRAAGLHRKIHLIFSAPWQAELVRADRQAAHDATLLAKLGDVDFTEARRVRAWITAHRQKAAIFAYLGSAE